MLLSPPRDSSDEEALELWTNAVQALRQLPDKKRRKQRRRLSSRIERAVKGQGDCRRLPPEIAKKILRQLKDQEDEDESSSDEESTVSSPVKSSEDECASSSR